MSLTQTDRILIPAPWTGFTEVDGGGLVLDARGPSTRLLNPTASLIWRLLDPAVPVDVLVAELADAFSLPAATIAADALPVLDLLEGEGLVVDAGDPTVDTDSWPADQPNSPAGSELEYLEIPPCGCVASIDDLPWAGEIPLRVGRAAFTLRCTDLGAVELLRAALAPHVTVDDRAQPYYSLDLRVDGDEPTFRLYRARNVICETPSTAVLWHHLRLALAAHAPTRADRVRLTLLAVAYDGRVALLPPLGRRPHPGSPPPQAVALAVGPTELIVGSAQAELGPGLDVDDAAASAFCDLHAPGARPLVAAPGRYELAALVASPGDGSADPVAEIAHHLRPHVSNAREVGAQPLLDTLVALRAVPLVAPDEVPAALGLGAEADHPG